jgi:hypothetical protein
VSCIPGELPTCAASIARVLHDRALPAVAGSLPSVPAAASAAAAASSPTDPRACRPCSAMLRPAALRVLLMPGLLKTEKDVSALPLIVEAAGGRLVRIEAGGGVGGWMHSRGGTAAGCASDPIRSTAPPTERMTT